MQGSASVYSCQPLCHPTDFNAVAIYTPSMEHHARWTKGIIARVSFLKLGVHCQPVAICWLAQRAANVIRLLCFALPQDSWQKRRSLLTPQ